MKALISILCAVGLLGFIVAVPTVYLCIALFGGDSIPEWAGWTLVALGFLTGLSCLLFGDKRGIWR